MKVLFIGDIVGKPGRDAVSALLPSLTEKFGIDFVIANAENSAGGFGITRDVADDLFRMGIDVLTGGNHIWDKKEAVTLLPKENRIIRPLNYPPGAPGFGSVIMRSRSGARVAVLNASGRVFMSNMDCPFRRTDEELEKIKGQSDATVIDFHAEATSEKVAYGYYLDGRVSAVLGTHTHVQTADERILPKGTAYISDTGMTGPIDSVIGVKKEQIEERFLTGMPLRFDVAQGPSIFAAVLIDINRDTGKAVSIERLQLTHP